jgi:hypothetical protein
MRRISFGVLATLFLVPVTRAGDESPVRGADLGTHVAGPAVTAEQLKGKVVFFEYWGNM